MLKLKNLFFNHNRYMEEAGEGGDQGQGGEGGKGANEGGEGGSLLDGNEVTLADGEYLLMDGVKGAGEMPEWYKSDKYKSVSEQARAYTELEKKFGSFKGAPKDGYSLPEGVTDEDALVAELIKFGEESQLSQEGFDKLYELGMAQAGVTEQVTVEQEIAKLGDSAPQRIKTVETFLKHKMGEGYEEVRELVNSADSILLVESIMKAVAPQKLPIDGGDHPAGLTMADIEAEMFKKDPHSGQLLRVVNREHEKKIQRMLKEYAGDKPHEIVVGG